MAKPGIEDVKDKIKKITFEDRNEVAATANETAEPAKAEPQKVDSRRKIKKNQVTAYLLDEELELLDALYIHKRKQKIKTDRSTIIGEAIKTLARLNL